MNTFFHSFLADKESALQFHNTNTRIHLEVFLNRGFFNKYYTIFFGIGLSDALQTFSNLHHYLFGIRNPNFTTGYVFRHDLHRTVSTININRTCIQPSLEHADGSSLERLARSVNYHVRCGWLMSTHSDKFGTVHHSRWCSEAVTFFYSLDASTSSSPSNTTQPGK